MKWKNLTMPKQIAADPSNNDHYGKFVVEPLERGFGVTLGNALRRVLLSSLQGGAISAVRIDGVLHEFSTLPGVIEDVTEIILNLKQVRLKLHGDGPKKGIVEIKGKGEVQAKDIQVDTDVQVLNPDLHIATLNRDGDLRMEVEISGGRGYVSADQHSQVDRPIGVIPIDSMFSPVTKVNYRRGDPLGQRIDYDTGSCSRCGRTAASCLRRGRRGRQDPARPLPDVHPLRVKPSREEVEKGSTRRSCGIRRPSTRAVDELSCPCARAPFRAAEIKTIPTWWEERSRDARVPRRSQSLETRTSSRRWACTSAWTSAASPSRATRWGWKSRAQPNHAAAPRKGKGLSTCDTARITAS
jgi:hypothetical protein